MNEPIRCSIGTEPSQLIPCEVLKSSILRRTSRPVEFTESFSPDGWDSRMIYLSHGTGFSGWRWAVPDVYDRTGKVIYLDADQVVLADIAELWESLPAGKAFAAVINAVGIFGKKTPEPNHVQTSVMVMDCGHPVWATVRQIIPAISYRNLMQATWLPRSDIHELPPEWNHFGIVTPETKLVHWSHVKSQPYRNPEHPTAHVFQRELFDAIDAGHIDRELLRDEVRKGHVAAVYWKRLKRRAAA